MRSSGSLKLSNAGEWQLGFTKMTDYARVQNPDEREVAMVRKRGSLKLSNAGE